MLIIRIKIILTLLIFATVVIGYAIAHFSHIQHDLLPREQSVHSWRISPGTDREDGGASTVDLKESTYNLNLDFNLAKAIPYPYITLGMTFDKDDPKNLENFSPYSSMMIRIKCTPANVLNLAILTYDDQVTIFSKDVRTFRPSLAFVGCNEEWSTVHLKLDDLDTPEWWLWRYNLSLANRDYALDKVRGFALSTSTQSPINTPSNIMIQDFVLEGKNLSAVYTLSTILSLLWAAFAGWCGYHFYLSRSQSKIVHEIVPVAYQAIPIEPRHEREKDAVLEYMASKYSHPELSVDIAVSELGINRVKINEILRAETGLTFSIYLNKLRLAEAARLLSDKKVGVAEAAFAVGYNSLSYFNRLFKKEYGCNPSSYKGPASSLKSPTVST